MTGDIDQDGEAELIKDYGKALECDIMKVPHHGSKYSSTEEFIKITDPDLAVFQVGKNNYGHPSEEAIKRYEAAGTAIVRNDKSGAIGVSVEEDGTIKVVSMID